MPAARDRYSEIVSSLYATARDAQRSPLRDLLAVIEEQMEAIAEGVKRLHDDAFIETGSGWAVPYLGDLVQQCLDTSATSAKRRTTTTSTYSIEDALERFARAAIARFEDDVRSIPESWSPRGLAAEGFAIRWKAGAVGALRDERFRDATFRSLRGSWRAFRGVSVPRARYDRALRRAMRAVTSLERVTIADFDQRKHLDALLALFRSVEDIKPTEAKWVSTSKTLHFVLPDLVPPIDNAFTVPFLRRAGVRMRPGIDRETLGVVFEQLSWLARLAGSQRLRDLSRDPRYPTPIGMARVVDFVVAARVLAWRSAS